MGTDMEWLETGSKKTSGYLVKQSPAFYLRKSEHDLVLSDRRIRDDVSWSFDKYLGSFMSWLQSFDS